MIKFFSARIVSAYCLTKWEKKDEPTREDEQTVITEHFRHPYPCVSLHYRVFEEVCACSDTEGKQRDTRKESESVREKINNQVLRRLPSIILCCSALYLYLSVCVCTYIHWRQTTIYNRRRKSKKVISKYCVVYYSYLWLDWLRVCVSVLACDGILRQTARNRRKREREGKK